MTYTNPAIPYALKPEFHTNKTLFNRQRRPNKLEKDRENKNPCSETQSETNDHRTSSSKYLQREAKRERMDQKPRAKAEQRD